LPLLRRRVGRAVRQAHHGPPAGRRAVLAGDDQGAEQVDPAFEVVVLGVEVDADEVRVQVRRGHRQAAVALAGDVAEGLGAVPADGAAEAPGPVDELIEPGADRPGGGDLPDLGLLTGCGDEFVGRAAARRGGEVLEGGEGADRGDARPPQGFLLGAGHVGEQRQVFPLGAPLHAELVVQAAVALERQAVRQLLERGAGHPPGRGVLAQHEVVGRLEVGVGVGDDFQQRPVQAENLPGGVPQRLDRFRLVRRGVGGWPEENAHPHRLVGHALGLEQPLQHQPVEGDLEAVLDLDLDGRFHVADQDEQGAVRRALQAQEVHVAPQQPAVQFGLQAGLEQQHRLTGGELAGLGDNFRVVGRAVVVEGVLGGVLDGAEALAEVRLDALLEGAAGQGQERGDPLRDHAVLLHELLPGPFRQSEAQVALALLQADEL
jgi:hypothetical protein